ncbi:Protein NDRG3-like protein [Dinothrombium tinctorium]|uniref:Protein NDRG3-like protein n=1 Tax=Dinothrombium tinctorium TaxID=1965070 RepID=A0A443QUZ2_9ACAR|nr:Protein NDRG3-like protein [Dinothrombium tinctorium]
MPLYYKKVQRNSSDAVRFIESRKRFSSGSVGARSKVNHSIKKDAIEMHSINVELDTISPLITSNRQLSEDLKSKEEYISTRYGDLLVARQGADHTTGKPVILTYHDIGMNYVANFEGFFNFTDNKILLQSFAVFHINAPGQETDRLPIGFEYPTMDQLASQVQDVLNHYNIKSFIGFGQGLGANVLSRLALLIPDSVDGLFLINPQFSKSSWSEWFYQKKNIRSLVSENSSASLPLSMQDYLMWYHFGRESEEREESSNEIMDIFREFYKGMSLNPYNLGLLIDSYIKRAAIAIERNGRNFKCQILVMTGALSPQLEDTVNVISRLDPKNSSWMKISGCGMVLQEKPHKVAEALRLFLQGLGYTLKAYERRRALMSGMSLPCLTNVGKSLNDRRMTEIMEFE